ncbi:hypothetical protein CHS0354_008288 [Potamilus streckersoni]|uniref:C2 domain-containing protein n=1 Tax=Potamilus streckersoni TaxID=2493646 RepID=A0AAE0RR07_9BIVA|nr:hypothetical protein CHS0354_008288 [Potamilus streckersoni]
MSVRTNPSQFQAGTAVIPATQVEITVSCRGLMDMDAFSKSDPICVLFTKDIKMNQFFEFGRTEVIKDSLNPDFAKKFIMNYFFEESQKIKFEIYDIDTPSARLADQDFLGRLECTLGEIVGAPGGKFERPLIRTGGNCGKIIVRAEELANCKELFTLQFKGINLDKKDFFGKSDPYLEFSRANEDGSFTLTHRTEVIKNTLNPTWAPFQVMARTLCNGDPDRTIRVQCLDWNRSGRPDFIGEFNTNFRELTKGDSSKNHFQVIDSQKQAKKKKYVNSGEIVLLSCKVDIQHTFLDYVQAGTQLNVTVAIDFTASNGNPSTPNSLHYVSAYGAPNQYASAIQAVGEIIQDYDSDKLFPALGFGARLSDGTVSHEFPLNFNPNSPFCAGINGILETYYNALRSVQLYGPTNFAPCVRHVARFATQYRDGSHYFILLIITDGVITDLPQTIEAIVEASFLPLSIIIVGVGDADFEAMNVLDGDDVRLSHQGKQAVRDIVQFVPFRDFTSRYGQNISICQAALAKEVLAEIPDQFLSYMRMNGINPKKQ